MPLLLFLCFLLLFTLSHARCEATAASSYTLSGAGQGNGIYTYVRPPSRVRFLSGGISLLVGQYKHSTQPFYISIGIVSGTGAWWANHRAKWELRDLTKILYRVDNFTKNQVPQSSNWRSINGIGNGPNLIQTCKQDISNTNIEDIGCFNDRNPRAFPVFKGRFYGDIISCAISCQGFGYFGLQDIIYNQQSQCYCGNNLTIATKYGRSSVCKHGMGASWKNSIYKNTVITTTMPPQRTMTPTSVPTLKPTQINSNCECFNGFPKRYLNGFQHCSFSSTNEVFDLKIEFGQKTYGILLVNNDKSCKLIENDDKVLFTIKSLTNNDFYKCKKELFDILLKSDCGNNLNLRNNANGVAGKTIAELNVERAMKNSDNSTFVYVVLSVIVFFSLFCLVFSCKRKAKKGYAMIETESSTDAL